MEPKRQQKTLRRVFMIAATLRQEMDEAGIGSMGQCLKQSRKLRQALEAVGIKVNLTAGFFNTDKLSIYRTLRHPHYWLELVEDKPAAERIIVDVTADQFDLWTNYAIPKVLIGTYNELQMYDYVAQ